MRKPCRDDFVSSESESGSLNASTHWDLIAVYYKVQKLWLEKVETEGWLTKKIDAN